MKVALLLGLGAFAIAALFWPSAGSKATPGTRSSVDKARDS